MFDEIGDFEPWFHRNFTRVSAPFRFGDVLDAYGTGVFGAGVTRSEKSKEMLSELARLNLKELDEGLSPEEQAEQTRLRGILVTAAYVLKEPPDDPHPGA